jgi:pilus assembly protein Flp/PilA
VQQPSAGTANLKEKKMNTRLHSLAVKIQNAFNSEEGQDLIEYALVVALIAFAATAGMGTLATDINQAFVKIGTSLTNAL